MSYTELSAGRSCWSRGCPSCSRLRAGRTESRRPATGSSSENSVTISHFEQLKHLLCTSQCVCTLLHSICIARLDCHLLPFQRPKGSPVKKNSSNPANIPPQLYLSKDSNFQNQENLAQTELPPILNIPLPDGPLCWSCLHLENRKSDQLVLQATGTFHWI